MISRSSIYAFMIAFDLALAVSLGRLTPALRVDVLDVGQGDAILVTTLDQNHILIDGGPDSRVLTELGEVLPLGFRDLDLVVLTHPHEDHLHGLTTVLERFHVKALLLSLPAYEGDAYDYFLDEVAAFEGPVYMAEAGTDFTLGTTQIDVLYPFEPTLGQDFKNVNNASVVLKVMEDGHSLLLMGDAEKEVEAELLAEGVDLSAKVLKAGHHGSHSSSTEAFLEEVDARWMLISCGTGNSYGHPHGETLNKAADLSMEVLRTDTSGRLSIVFGSYSWVRSIFAPRVRSFSSKPS